MPRPKKCRRICALPENGSFGPVSEGGKPAEEPVIMTLDEYETIRLIDLLACTQEECAGQMGVARTTIQAVYNSARHKLALALVTGRHLEIRGGDYVLCPRGKECRGKNCGKQDCGTGCCEGGERPCRGRADGV